MLSMLQNCLRTCIYAGQGGSGSPGDKALSDAIQGLASDGRERGLMDKTYRQQQGAGDPKDGARRVCRNSKANCAMT